VGQLKSYVCATACALLAALLIAGPASAKTVELTKYNGTYPGGSIDGSDAVGIESPTFPNGSLQKMDIDQSNGDILVASSGFPERIYKFDESGASAEFSALSPKTIISPQSFGYYGDLEIDNSGTASQGQFYAFPEYGPINGYQASGAALGGGFPIEGTGDVCGAAVGPDGHFWRDQYNQGIHEYDATGVATGTVVSISPGNFCDFDMDAEGNFYTLAPYYSAAVLKYNSTGEFISEIDSGPATALAIDLSNGDLYVDEGNIIKHYTSEGGLLDTFGQPDEPSYPGLSNSRGIAVNEHTHTVYAANNRNPTTVDSFSPTGAITIPTVTTGVPDVEPTTAVLRGIVDPDGIDTTDCEFEWGPTSSYGHKVECEQGKVFAGASGENNVSAAIAGLTKGSPYHFRVTAANENGVVSKGGDHAFTASGLPIVEAGVSKLNTDGAQFDVTIDPNGGNTTYHLEYGTEVGVYEESTEEEALETNVEAQSFSHKVTGLTPETEYHYRVVAHNDAGTTNGPDQTFKTFPPPPPFDPCGNALVRKQTGAALVPDCRAYELVSAADQGGYDVESDLLAGQEPLEAYPDAPDKVLYSMHFGALSVSGSPTNFGHDPYVATRSQNGWTTEYVGLPADGMPSTEPYGSPLAGSDSGLNEFAFAGDHICRPCFSDGSSNVPVRVANGTLIKGMAGSLNPAAEPVGEVRKRFSADGSKFLFASDMKFDAAATSGSMWIYERDLGAATTQLVSTLPSGAPIGGEVAELDVSADGTRVLVGQVVDEDAVGNRFYDLYMHMAGSPNSVKVVDTPSGVIYNGMTGDGTKVFFTTPDPVATSENQDSDSSADLFRADVGSGSAALQRVSTGSGGTGNTDGCEPIADWNVVSGGPDCSTVAFAGGAGVASGDGTVFFVSPERLDGVANGIPGQPNLYVARPSQPPHFVATIDSSLVKPGPQPPEHPVVDSEVGGHFDVPEGLAVDQSNGDIYIPELSTGTVLRLKPNGESDDFTAGTAAGTNELTGFEWAIEGTAQVAVDNSGGPTDGDFYVESGACCFENKVDVYSSAGEHLQTLTGSGNPNGEFGLVCGIAVDQSNGAIYIGDYFGYVWRYSPSGGTVEEGDYSGAIATGSFSGTCDVASDAGKVYIGHVEGERALDVYPSSAFTTGTPLEPTPTEQLTTEVVAVATDHDSGEVFVDKGPKIYVFDSSGVATASFGGGAFSGSSGVAVRSSNHHVFATSGKQAVTEFGYVIPPYHPIEQPAIVHGVAQAATHSYGDFQVTPDGDFAAFSSLLPLTGAVTHGHYEIYRYDSGSGELECVSCGPSNSADVQLSGYGLNLTDDGEAFFTSAEQFVLRDTNEKKDVYEFENGDVQIISGGTGPADSGLVTVSRDGENVYFFTRDSLAPQDENGSLMKIYDAREGGGFLFTREPQPCAASDECHGPGTQAGQPPVVNTFKGSGKPTEPISDCASLARRAKHIRARAAQLRKRASKASSAGHAHSLRGRARALGKKARRVARKAHRCSGGGE
jgi:hypothetical protein